MTDKTHLVRYDDAAEQLGISRRHLVTLIQEGYLTPIHIGRRGVRLEAADIEAFIESRRGRRPRKAS